MTTKPTRRAPMSGALAQAIDRHNKAAQAATSAFEADPEDCPEYLRRWIFNGRFTAASTDREYAAFVTLRLRYRTWKLRALIWVLRRLRPADYRSILREKEKQMETIPKERLHRIGIQNDISVAIKPSSIMIPFAAYGFIAVGAAVIIYLFLQLNHHGIVTKVQYNGCDGCALGQLEQ